MFIFNTFFKPNFIGTPQCDAFFIDSKVILHSESCVSTVCITVGSTLNETKISYWDLFGVDFKKDMFFSIETGWELSDFFSIRLKPSNGIDINRPYCFNLSGLFMSSNSNIMLNVNGYTCQKLAVAPKFRTECSLDCVVDSNFANAKCEPCRATCIKDQESTAVGTQTCTMNVLKSPNSLGKPCSTISTNVCSITCPVDCKYDGPFWQNCPANCATPTSTRRGYYSIVRPNLNGGKTCLNSTIQYELYPTALTSTNALEIVKPYDIVIDCSDNVATRYLMNDACVLLNKPLVSGSAIRFEGQLTVYHAHHSPCYRCLFPIPPPSSTVSNCDDVGVLGPITGILGSMQALEAIKYLVHGRCNYLGKLLLLDGNEGTFRVIPLRPPQPHCQICGTHPVIRQLIDYPEFCGSGYDDKVTTKPKRNK
ncbi:Molybdenum cofactor synthesis protein 3 [Coelomomyces lativittatus]|nr:Molybdenum cofactor synthesis protein 3 [Coelomomyces lativittatus]